MLTRKIIGLAFKLVWNTNTEQKAKIGLANLNVFKM